MRCLVLVLFLGISSLSFAQDCSSHSRRVSESREALSRCQQARGDCSMQRNWVNEARDAERGCRAQRRGHQNTHPQAAPKKLEARSMAPGEAKKQDLRKPPTK